MTPEAFALLRDAEGSWWYQARAAIVKRVLGKFFHRTDGRLLDFGAGFGGMGAVLAKFGTVSAFEPNASAAEACAHRGYARVMRDESELASASGAYDVICTLDVLEHVPDDAATLAQFHRLLAPNGSVLLTVPAFPSLWSRHDREHHHFRRYTRNGLRRLLVAQGFDVAYLGYWNCLLFLPMFLARRLGFADERALRPSPRLNAGLRALLRLEERLIPAIRLPFGSSLIAYARKNPHL